MTACNRSLLALSKKGRSIVFCSSISRKLDIRPCLQATQHKKRQWSSGGKLRKQTEKFLCVGMMAHTQSFNPKLGSDEVKKNSSVYVAPRKVWPHPMWLCHHHHHHRVPYIDNAHNSVTPSKMWWDSLRIQPTLGLIPALFQTLGNENLWFVVQSPKSRFQMEISLTWYICCSSFG